MAPFNLITHTPAREHDRAWRPEILDLAACTGRARLADLIADRAIVSWHDTIQEQLRDLLAGRHPQTDLDKVALGAHVNEHLGAASPDEHGRWIYYPWSGQLVHLLPEAEFRDYPSWMRRVE